MKWRRTSPDTMQAGPYMVTRYELNGTRRYTAWGPDRSAPLLAYWGESADEAKRACEEHAREGAT